MSEKETSKKLTVSVIILIILSVALCITTFALVWATVSVDNNMFHTGIVKINLNDGNTPPPKRQVCAGFCVF